MPVTELFLLGRLDLRRDGQPVGQELLAQSRPTALLIYLALARPGHFVRRDTLATLFWGESDQESARRNLRKTVHTLRQSLGDDLVEARGDEELGLARALFWCDAVEFSEESRKGNQARAMELYVGELVPAFRADAPQFDDWLDRTRVILANTAATNAWVLARRLEEEQQLTGAADWARRALELGNVDERRLRQVLMLFERAGDHASALRLYEVFRRQLERDYSALPAPETRALVERIRRG
ncbi:MAG: hypothetical protein DMD35_21465 [Gemmatimonadetes bacterium]|nr:MAG: hypothetical protein DMD35_21465 [Gemmatimonadota bacterium]